MSPQLARSRQGRNGSQDLSIDVWRSRGRELNLRLPLPGLEPNPDADGKRRWPMLDSLGRPLLVLEQDGGTFTATDPDKGFVTVEPGSVVTFASGSGVLIHQDRRARLSLQGRGAMADAELEASSALLAFDARDRSDLPPGASIVPYRVRAFIARAALPRRSGLRRIRAEVDRAVTGDGESDLAVLSREPLSDPSFRHDERFVGEDGRARTYATYNAKPPYGDAIYLTVNTTGVHGGGIVRAVAREGDEVEILDELPDPDTNAEGGTPIARWRFVRLAGTPICGWVPTRA
jgi:hypothetical protein